MKRKNFKIMAIGFFLVFSISLVSKLVGSSMAASEEISDKWQHIGYVCSAWRNEMYCNYDKVDATGPCTKDCSAVPY